MSLAFTWELVIRAYAAGYFPMADPRKNEILWYKPDPRAILPLDKFHVSHSLSKVIRQKKYQVTFDTAFSEVMKGCANRAETWISDDFFRVYGELFDRGFAHSAEIWMDKTLVGGVYGVSLGAAFFAESKFHTKTNASKLALYHLVEKLKASKFQLLEVQFVTDHLKTFGAEEISDAEYEARLMKAVVKRTTWQS